MEDSNVAQVVETLTKVDNTVEVLAARAVAISKQLESYKALYEELDTIAAQLKAARGVGVFHAVPSGAMVVTVVDNFEDTNVVWKPAGVRRFELKVEDADKYAKRLQKAVK